ncbi:MAG: 50S ribosomal protein L17 [Cyclobacteriaceae bacterium]
MRHGKKFNHLGRKSAHREALLSNMASSLIIHKRISTTVAKAKALRKYVEPLLTKSKDDTTHSRRTVFSYLQNKESVQTLFGEVASKISDRPGGYTRIIKLAGTRLGDNAEMCFIELVDFNTLYTKESAVKKAKTRRSRRGKKDEGAETTGEVEVTDAPESEKAEKKAKKKTASPEEPKAEKKKPALKPKKDKK